jgi:DNA ligase-1
MGIYDVLTTIQNTPGSNDKKTILKENMSATLKMIFEDTYGPQKYFIKKFECPRSIGNGTLDDDYDTFHIMLGSLACREVTGDKAYRQLQVVVAMYTPQAQEILCRIIDRNLKVGISLDNFLDVIGEKESKFEVALAMNLDKVKGINPIDGTYFISRKLDGCRCICYVNKVFSDTWVEFKTRQNKIITTLDNLVEPIKEFTKNFGPGEYVLDGEVCIMDENGNENFQGLMKEVTRKDHTIENPRYNVFDVLTRSEFDGETESPNFTDRLNMMHDLLTPNKNVVLLEQEMVTSQEVLDRWTNKAQELGWEGCMLRKDAAYKRGRSKDLIKIKKFQDAEYIVEGIIEGTATYNEGGAKEYPVVAALIITHKGNQVKVGSGLSKEQRIGWLQNPEGIIGKTVTVQYFEETQDSKTKEYSLRFPVLKHVYDNGRNI